MGDSRLKYKVDIHDGLIRYRDSGNIVKDYDELFYILPDTYTCSSLLEFYPSVLEDLKTEGIPFSEPHYRKDSYKDLIYNVAFAYILLGEDGCGVLWDYLDRYARGTNSKTPTMDFNHFYNYHLLYHPPIHYSTKYELSVDLGDTTVHFSDHPEGVRYTSTNQENIERAIDKLKSELRESFNQHNWAFRIANEENNDSFIRSLLAYRISDEFYQAYYDYTNMTSGVEYKSFRSLHEYEDYLFKVSRMLEIYHDNTNEEGGDDTNNKGELKCSE